LLGKNRVTEIFGVTIMLSLSLPAKHNLGWPIRKKVSVSKIPGEMK